VPAAIGATLAHAIVLAGAAQLLVTGVGFLRRGSLKQGLLNEGLSNEDLSKEDLLAPTSALQFGFSPEARRFFALAIPGIVAAGIPQLKLIAGAMIASSSQAAVSWLYYANRLYELPLGVVSIAIAAVLVPAIAAGMRGSETDGIGRSAAAQSRGFEIALALALPAAVAFAVLAQPIAGALFERGAFGPHDTTAVAAALAAICAGLPGHALEKVFGAVSFAHEDTHTPMLAALAGLATATAGGLALFPFHGHVGIAAAIGMSGWVGASLLGIILWRRGWVGLDRTGARRLPRIIAATAVMAVAILGLHELLGSLFPMSGSSARVAVLALLVATGLAVYGASLQMLGVARLRDLVRAVRHRA
jgi:putative peptidoglycan lipid II flippase